MGDPTKMHVFSQVIAKKDLMRLGFGTIQLGMTGRFLSTRPARSLMYYEIHTAKKPF